MTPACIETTYAKNLQGYGNVWNNGRQVGHHRLAYCDANGLQLTDIKGKVVRHTCDNPSCVNPAHLVLGTTKDNAADRQTRGRWKGGQPLALTATQVEEIRSNRQLEQRVLAKIYKVAHSTIGLVLRQEGAYAPTDKVLK